MQEKNDFSCHFARLALPFPVGLAVLGQGRRRLGKCKKKMIFLAISLGLHYLSLLVLLSSGKVGGASEMQEKNRFFLPFRSACTTFVASKPLTSLYKHCNEYH
jgi:hypothetical protein